MEGMAEAAAVPLAPLQELVLTLEQAAHMAKQLPATTDPTHLLQIYTSTSPRLTPASSLQGYGDVDFDEASSAGDKDSEAGVGKARMRREKEKAADSAEKKKSTREER